MEVILKVTVLFTLVLALSFLIERLLELLKAIYDLLDSYQDWHRFWTRRAVKIRDRLQNRLNIFEYVKPEQAARILNRFREMILPGDGKTKTTLPVLSGDLVRYVYIKVAGKLIGISLGIGLAFWMQLDLLAVWQGSSAEAVWDITIKSESLRIALTGVIMGLGSSPVHKVIQRIEKKRKFREQKGGQS